MNIQPHACALLADFTRLPKGEALPCIAWLDLAESRLAPGALQRQKFVYHIAPTDRREALDTARFALRTCAGIPFDAYKNLRARADGRPLKQDAIRPLEEGGILVDWPLGAVSAALSLEFSLEEARPIGRAEAFFPGRTPALALSGPVCPERAAGQYPLEITLPFEKNAPGRVGQPAIWCLGAPEVQDGGDGRFVIRQRLLLDLPAAHGAQPSMGAPHINQSIT